MPGSTGDHCDLETLQALIDDSEDEEDLTALASLAADDFEFEQNSPSRLVERPSLTVKDVSNQCGASQSSSVGDAHTTKICITTSEDDRHRTVEDSRLTDSGSPKNMSALQSGALTKIDNSNQQSSSLKSCLNPEALLEEMAKMQQKMLELQRMLKDQQQATLANPGVFVQQNEKKSHSEDSHIELTPQRLKDSSSKLTSLHLKNSRLVTTGKDGKIQSKQLSSSIKADNCLNTPKALPALSEKGTPSTSKTNSSSLNNSVLKLIPDSEDIFQTQPRRSSSSTPQSAVTKDIKKQKTPVSSEKVGTNRQRMEKELFGDSDSDWEMDREDKQYLSESGREIKQMLVSNQTSREAHPAKFSLSNGGSGHLSSQSWSRSLSEGQESQVKSLSSTGDHQQQDKNSLHCKVSSSDQAKPATKVSEDEHTITESFSKIRIVNPLISSSLIKMRMEGRKMINISKLHLKLKTPELQGDWVTIAVIVGKTEAKSSSSGKPYCIWKLNDLENLDNSVSFFLFGDVHKQLWKTEVGTVVGVLNPSIMDSLEKKSSEPAFTIKNPGQLMIMGRSKDLGWCSGWTKKGNKCGRFINKKLGDFCAYHVQAAYRKVSATRLELHGSVNGIRPKSFEQKIFSKDCAYMYGGQTFVPHASTNKSSKNKVTLKKLQQNMQSSQISKVNTMSIHSLQPEPAVSLPAGKIKPDDPANTFVDMISVPSTGSMNFVAFLKKKEQTKSEFKNTSTKTFMPGVTVQSVSAIDLIKQHQSAMNQRMPQKRKASEQLLADANSPCGQLRGSPAGASGQPNVSRPPGVASDAFSHVPILAKGFYGGQDIHLDVAKKSMSTADRAKLKAILSVKEKGGIHKQDPNATKKADVDLETIHKRVDLSSKLNESLEKSPASGPKLPEEPPHKKSRLLCNISLNSDEIKKLIKAKSKHVGALSEAEAEREEIYFNELEKKEMLENKMSSITSIEITVVTCKQCSYTAQSANDSCKQDGHTLVRSKSKKRFFVCKKCKHRTYIIGSKFPTEACRKCGAQSFEKTSMHKERAGPVLESEVLNIRGDEVKFLNSLDHKVFLQTVIDN